MFIILEGIDGAGKSTLAADISRRADFEKFHLGPPATPETVLDECIGGEFGKYLPGKGIHIISDRLHWGSPVYAPIYRPEADLDGYGELGKAGWRYSELFFESRGVVTAFIDTPPGLARERLEANGGDSYIDLDHLIQLSDRYNWLYGESVTAVAKVGSDEKLEITASKLVEAARGKEIMHSPLARWRHYIGPAEPDRLIVCPPMREARLEILESLSDEDWMRTGICSSSTTPGDLSGLVMILGKPELLGIGKLPGPIENFIFTNDGVLT